MIDLAIESGVSDLELVVDKAVLNELDWNFLKIELKSGQSLTSEQVGPDEFILTFKVGL